MLAIWIHEASITPSLSHSHEVDGGHEFLSISSDVHTDMTLRTLVQSHLVSRDCQTLLDQYNLVFRKMSFQSRFDLFVGHAMAKLLG